MTEAHSDIVASANIIRRTAFDLARDILADGAETGKDLTAMGERISLIAAILEQSENIISAVPSNHHSQNNRLVVPVTERLSPVDDGLHRSCIAHRDDVAI